MTELDVQKGLYYMFNSHHYMFTNLYFFKNESDWLSFLPSGYCYDVEVKISRSDFFADFKKERHLLMKAAYDKKEHVVIPGNEVPFVCPIRWSNERGYRRSGFTGSPGYLNKGHARGGYCALRVKKSNMVGNRFFFATPVGLIKPEEVPEYAGLIEIDEFWKGKKIKDAPLLHKQKHDVTIKFNMIYRLYESQLRKKLVY